MVWQTQLVQGLQAAVGASFGAVVHIVPAPHNLINLYGAATLYEVARAARDADEVMAVRLGEEALKVRRTRNTEAARHAWIRFTEIVSGHKTSQADPSGSLLERLNAVVMNDTARRSEWVSEGLEAIGITELMRRSIVEKVRGIREIRLVITRGGDMYFRSRLIEHEGCESILEITTPRNQMVLTEKQIKLLSARAFLLADAGSEEITRRLAPFMRVRAGSLSQPICPIIEASFVDRLCKALRANKKFRSFVDTVPQDKGLTAAFDPEVLTALAKKIGEAEPNLGARLMVLAAKVHAADSNRNKYLAWERYVSSLEEAGCDAVSAKPIVSMAAVQDAVEILTGPDRARRRAWLAEGLKQLGISDTAVVLESYAVRINERRGIYPFFVASSDGQFSSSFSDTSQTIDIVISVPDENRQVGLSDIQLLVSRAILMAYAEPFMPNVDRREHSKMGRKNLGRTIPVMTLHRDGRFARLGRVRFSGRQLASFSRMMRWLSAGSAVIAPPRRSELADKLRPVKPPEGTDHDMWRSLFSVPNATKVAFDYLQPALGLVRNFAFKVSNGDDDNIQIELKTAGREEVIHVLIPEKDLKDITDFDLIDIMLRVAHYTDLKDHYREELRHQSESRGHSRHFIVPPSRDPCVIGLEELKRGADLTPEVKIARSFFRLALAFRALDDAAPDTVDVTGDVADSAKHKLANALTAISRAAQMMPQLRAGWEDILRIKRWHLQNSGVRINGDLMIDAIPARDAAIVHIHDDAEGVAATSWLYLLSVMAANPSYAVRVNSERRSVAVGGQGDPMQFYESIAANRIFQPFGVFDSMARMPASISFSMPGGIAAEKNPHYSGAAAKAKENYVKALRWFAITPMPDDWRPLATDTYEVVRKKYRTMSKAWHPDKKPGPDKVALFGVATGHWESILNLYQTKEDGL